ncbi:uncharacterized protein METZ01_LOCUS476514 [marine metagenome]|uniref:Uncharacterized protein n=1 Tax=marine metagenome TaxID=408172 RepID=A0A383BV21_9ZZZZ
MKSYIQGIVTGGALVFSFMVLVSSQDSHDHKRDRWFRYHDHDEYAEESHSHYDYAEEGHSHYEYAEEGHYHY